MDYCLPPHISFGFVGSRLVLLDLVADRYLLLGAAEAATLVALASGNIAPEPALAEKLARRGFIVRGEGVAIMPVDQMPPTASILEVAAAGGGVGIWEAIGSSLGALAALRLYGLSRAVSRWRRLRDGYAARNGGLADDPERAAFLARGFAEARIAVPMPRLCVPDSLALARALWRRGLAADVYFGVQLDPLLAHAWVQRGPLILSDPLNIAADYKPVFKL